MVTRSRFGPFSLLAMLIMISSTPDLSQAEISLTPDQRALLERFKREFIELRPGSSGFPDRFVMGSDTADANQRPAREVQMRAFAIAKYEVTQNLWEAVMGANPSRWKGPRNSVEMLSFDDAQAFCERATRMMRVAKLISADEAIRLPSEAEWEYAARAGTQTVYSFGDDVSMLGDYAWFTGNAAGNDPPVGAKRPNAWKLYDVHGYLWEWCADPAHDNYQGAPTTNEVWQENGKEPLRVLRGGSWKDGLNKLTSRYRRFAPKSFRDDAVGLRCVKARVAAGTDESAD